GVVSIAHGPRDFVRACEQILRWTNADRARFRRRAQEIVERSSWERTVADIERLLERFEKPLELGVGVETGISAGGLAEAGPDLEVEVELEAFVDAAMGVELKAG